MQLNILQAYEHENISYQVIIFISPNIKIVITLLTPSKPFTKTIAHFVSAPLNISPFMSSIKYHAVFHFVFNLLPRN